MSATVLPVTTRDAVLSMRGISKSFAGIRVLHGIDLDLYPGEVLALMGENGAGKSTLMKIVSGIHAADTGTIEVDSAPISFADVRAAERAGIAIIHQELNLVPGLSVAENIFLGREPRRGGVFVDFGRMRQEAGRLLQRLGLNVPAEREAGELRIGEKQLVEIAKALSLGARVLIMDEPTSALSPGECHRLFAVIRQLTADGVAIIYISHRLDEVTELADRVMVLRDGQMVVTAPIAEMPQQRIISSMVGRSIAVMQHTQRIFEDRARLSVRHLGYTRHDRQGVTRQLLRNVSFDVRPGEILGIGGLLGSGRTEILECLFGAARGEVSGDISIDGQAVEIANPQRAKAHGLAFVTEERKTTGLFLAAPIAENMTLPSLRRLSRFAIPDRTAEASMVGDLFKRLTVRARNADQRVQELSGGNQQKVVLAKWLGTRPSILLLDEPTRGIDVGAKAEIYELIRALAADGLSILLVSSELPELLLLADRILVMCEGRQVGILDRQEATEEKFMTMAAPKSGDGLGSGRA